MHPVQLWVLCGGSQTTQLHTDCTEYVAWRCCGLTAQCTDHTQWTWNCVNDKLTGIDWSSMMTKCEGECGLGIGVHDFSKWSPSWKYAGNWRGHACLSREGFLTPAHFNGCCILASLLHRHRSTEVNQTLHSVWPSPGLVYIHFGGPCPLIEFCQVERFFQFDQQHSTGAPPILGWATVMACLHCRMVRSDVSDIARVVSHCLPCGFCLPECPFPIVGLS